MKKLKRVLLFAGVLYLLCSCAGFPKPESEGNSLVIGNLILDFPDGFFDTSLKTAESGILLNFKNVTKNTRFTLLTSGGYFYFLTNGSDEYSFESYKFEMQLGGMKYSIGETPLGLKIATSPRKVIYLGHMKVTYAAPQSESRGGEGSSDWKYKTSWSRNVDKNEVIQYIQKKQPDSPWLAYEIVEYGK